MNEMIDKKGLKVDISLVRFVEDEAIPGTGVDPEAFWTGFDALVRDVAPRNRALLDERARLQAELDGWHRSNPGPVKDLHAYRKFLEEIGYIVPTPAHVQATTANVDREISEQAGPQLVVPLSNLRYALNAANARWGSLYDALYGSDAIGEADGAERTAGFNPKRGVKVIAYARAFLDDSAPLMRGSHADATKYSVEQGKLVVTLTDGTQSALKAPRQFAGYQGEPAQPSAVLLEHHDLHFEIQIDREHPIGKSDRAHVKDILMEAAVSTIIDCEDSVAAVDADDKVQLYRNWLGLMQGNLSEPVTKNDKTFIRTMNPDREYATPDGSKLTLHGRSLLFVRNVGHLMTNPAVIDNNGNEIPEGILDAVMTTFGALHDLEKKSNSRTGSIYIVKAMLIKPCKRD